MNKFLRSFLKIILTIILVISLILFVTSLSLFQFTSYQNLEPRLNSFIEQQFSQEFSQISPEETIYLREALIENCSKNPEIIFPLDPNSMINEVKINCSEVNNETTTEQLAGIVSRNIFNSIYYKNYDCSFISCITQIKSNPENIFILVSKKGNSFLLNSTLIFLIISLILILGIVLLSKPKFTSFYNLASAFLISGLLFLIKSPLNSIASSSQEPVKSIAVPLIKTIFTNFLFIFILGAIFLILSIIFRATKKSEKRTK